MHILYKTTNIINEKYYIGVTNGNNLWYKGSGTALKNAIKKYGITNFTRETLETFDNSVDAYIKENEIVNEDFVANRNTYNMKIGGYGGKGQIKTAEHKQKIAESVRKRHNEGRYNASRPGRKPAMNTKLLLLTVKKLGIKGAAKELNLSFYQCRDRYYRVKNKGV
ncbi:MAG: hypothetical protein DRQ47_01930 [Gammaproteobacteria bacterium]|nr:MAG: hypothetical protein DRQ47_01930 [Gammaproteobacteria bacterium]